MDVSIVVPTFRRPAALSRCINSCLAQTGLDTLAYEVIVVDNCPERSAHDTVHGIASRGCRPIIYTHQPLPGLAHARNHGVSIARAPLIAFIDDDECADPNWVTQLLGAQSKFDADVVFGRVVGVIEENSRADPEFVRDFYSIDFRQQSGPIMDEGGSGNALLRRKRCFEGGHAFNPQLGFVGGEDVLFFMQLARTGASLVWCREAVTYEMVPFRRTTPAYILRRCIVQGQVTPLTHSLLCPPEWRAVAWFMMTGTAQFFVFGLAAACMALGSRRRAVRMASRAFWGLGKALWMSPFRINYYGPSGTA
jgi:succinoglycan biosynthesis protein ExoM